MDTTPFTIRPATSERFDDVATVLGPRNPDSTVCWCLTYRLPSRENRALTARERARKVQELCARPIPPGVLAYDGDTVVGWCGVAPRAELHTFSHSRTIPHVDDLPVWTVWCFRVRGGRRGRGVARALLDGAVEHARGHGAPAIEGYPVDNGDRRVDTTMAYVGTRAMFERAGFTWAADTTSTLNGFPRVLMRRSLR
ncbi:GNAT family N-acetyltransferase [Kocuria sediminis]|uniref:GNAT family N-acetyltransferase n=1 Tax=Kocuria sediminis TaxID=1038857 RepID=A0A6N8GMG4_9MICC|nr:GNAT family N-acetyltransferase [Kocuria sediminis]MUN63457.1 GNAT family N-acetyltransferase [Kocuria sediminis]